MKTIKHRGGRVLVRGDGGRRPLALRQEVPPRDGRSLPRFPFGDHPLKLERYVYVYIHIYMHMYVYIYI